MIEKLKSIAAKTRVAALEQENAKLRARVERLEKVREAAREYLRNENLDSFIYEGKLLKALKALDEVRL